MKSKITLLLLILTLALNAQNDGGALAVSLNFGGQIPAGDMADRFGNNLYVGANVEYLTNKSNFIFGISHSFMFGSTVKEDVLSSLRNESGIIYGDQFTRSAIELRERGIFTSVHVGKLFSLIEDNQRSGIRVHLGLGLLQHKVRIQDDPVTFVTQLSGDLKRGYDRLTNGLALSQFIGYQHLAKNRLANFFVGVEIIEGFTKNRRDINVDTGQMDFDTRLDIMWGIKVGWIVPFYIGREADTLYY